MSLCHRCVVSVVALCSGCGGWGAPSDACPSQETDELRQDAVDAFAALEPIHLAADAWSTMKSARHDAVYSLLLPLDVGSSGKPEDLPMTFVGDGTYELTGDWGRATWRLRDADGALVQHDLFDSESYLVGAVTTIDWDAGITTVDYSEPGPLAAWLGFGEDPPRPLVYATDQLPETDLIDELDASLEVEVAGVVGPVYAEYSAATRFKPIGDPGPFALELDDDELVVERAGEPFAVFGWNVVIDGHFATPPASGGFEVRAELEGRPVLLNAGAHTGILGEPRCIDP